MLSPSILFSALAAQFIFIVINWYFFRRKEYTYYLLYIITVSAYYFNKYASGPDAMVHIFSFSYHKFYPDKILAILSYLYYFKFGRHFVEAALRYPRMNRHIILAEKILAGYIVFDLLLLVLSNSFSIERIFFLPLNVCMSVFLGYLFYNMLKKNEVLDKFIIYGSIFYALAASVTIWVASYSSDTNDDAFLILQIGTVTEMLFLNAGIMYKSKMLQKQTIDSQKLLIERYSENQQLLLRLAGIREKISRDLHDDVGATLSSIKAYSEILKHNPGDSLISELINNNSAEMIEKLEVIAWATDPEQDNVKSLLSQMKKFALPLCHTHHIDCTIQCSGIDEKISLPGEFRQNLLLIFKEAINNMIKYAEATSCIVTLSHNDSQFAVIIADNGNGFDGTVKGTGSGWNNMKKRTTELNGHLQIQSSRESGTSISLTIPYPFKIPNSWDEKRQVFG